MGRVVELFGEFDLQGIDRLCAALAPLSTLTSPEPVSLDLTRLAGLGAPALAVLVSVLRTVHANRLCDPLAKLSPPAEGPVSAILSPANLRALIEHPADGEILTGAASGVCEPFSSIEGIARIREALIQRACSRVPLPCEAQEALRQLIWDLAHNVLQHADIGGGVAALVVDPQAQTLELAVADRGIGIRRSLGKNMEFEDLSDDAAALSTALQPGRSGESGSGRGMGLYLTKLVLASNEGALTVRSGSALLEAPAGGSAFGPLVDFHGTLVSALARLDRPLDQRAVHRALADPHGVMS